MTGHHRVGEGRRVVESPLGWRPHLPSGRSFVSRGTIGLPCFTRITMLREFAKSALPRARFRGTVRADHDGVAGAAHVREVVAKHLKLPLVDVVILDPVEGGGDRRTTRGRQTKVGLRDPVAVGLGLVDEVSRGRVGCGVPAAAARTSIRHSRSRTITSPARDAVPRGAGASRATVLLQEELCEKIRVATAG